MRKASEWKSVFCLEGLWSSNLKDRSSVEPALHLLNRQYPAMKYIHKDCATKSEFKFYLNKWTQKGYYDYPILYLSFHGNKEVIKLSDGKYDLIELAKELQGKCKNRIIVFASCSTMDINKNKLNSFIRETECLAVCGYRAEVNWTQATAFEILLLEGMQDNEFSGRGIDTIEKQLNKLSKPFKDLKFRMVTNKK